MGKGQLFLTEKGKGKQLPVRQIPQTAAGKIHQQMLTLVGGKFEEWQDQHSLKCLSMTEEKYHLKQMTGVNVIDKPRRQHEPYDMMHQGHKRIFTVFLPQMHHLFQ